mmetsp:Transcript_28481/g.85957  ORF Transcript_28481/g.85957 Transcript_28481/m.85957 type:complete len:203 (-) Transcript_28481:5-613(-)
MPSTAPIPRAPSASGARSPPKERNGAARAFCHKNLGSGCPSTTRPAASSGTVAAMAAPCATAWLRRTRSCSALRCWTAACSGAQLPSSSKLSTKPSAKPTRRNTSGPSSCVHLDWLSLSLVGGCVSPSASSTSTFFTSDLRVPLADRGASSKKWDASSSKAIALASAFNAAHGAWQAPMASGAGRRGPRGAAGLGPGRRASA